MAPKLTSAITKITLNDATFHNKGFTPTYINFLFGNNGCGKSTISRSIKGKVGLEWEAGRTADDFNLLVYNEDFIKRNIASYGGLPGVFTISEQNAEVQQKIDETSVMHKKPSQKLLPILVPRKVLLANNTIRFRTSAGRKPKTSEKQLMQHLPARKPKKV